jgi:hypothetical protein
MMELRPASSDDIATAAEAIWPFIRTLKWCDVVVDAQHHGIREMTEQIAKTAPETVRS